MSPQVLAVHDGPLQLEVNVARALRTQNRRELPNAVDGEPHQLTAEVHMRRALARLRVSEPGVPGEPTDIALLHMRRPVACPDYVDELVPDALLRLATPDRIAHVSESGTLLFIRARGSGCAAIRARGPGCAGIRARGSGEGVLGDVVADKGGPLVDGQVLPLVAPKVRLDEEEEGVPRVPRVQAVGDEDILCRAIARL